jgi:hypothetical protein
MKKTLLALGLAAATMPLTFAGQAAPSTPNTATTTQKPKKVKKVKKAKNTNAPASNAAPKK